MNRKMNDKNLAHEVYTLLKKSPLTMRELHAAIPRSKCISGTAAGVLMRFGHIKAEALPSAKAKAATDENRQLKELLELLLKEREERLNAAHKDA